MWVDLVFLDRQEVLLMTPEERQELRRWSAEDLLGWYLQDQMVMVDSGKEVLGYFNKNCLICYQHEWQPDSDEYPAWQIRSVIEKMRELGFNFLLEKHLKYHETYFAVFWINPTGEGVGKNTGKGFNDNPFLAILLAAKAAWEGRNDKR